MTTEVKVSVSTNLDLFVLSSYSIAVTVEDLSNYFILMRDWCIINLDEGTWKFDSPVCVKDSTDKEMIFASTATFDRPEDATAFKIKFGVIDL